jgi:plastocyanin
MRVMRVTRMSVVVLAVLAVSCGGSDGGGGGGQSPAPTPSPTPNPSPPPAGQVNIVGELGNQSFNPNPVPAPGTNMLVWNNADGVVHRIVANDGSFDTGNISPGASSDAIPVPTDGANYHCSIHPAMIGVVNSTGGSTPPCTGIYC